MREQKENDYSEKQLQENLNDSSLHFNIDIIIDALLSIPSMLCLLFFQKSANNDHHHYHHQNNNHNNNNNNATSTTGATTSSSSTRLQSSKMRDPNEPHIGKYRFIKVNCVSFFLSIMIFFSYRPQAKVILLKLSQLNIFQRVEKWL